MQEEKDLTDDIVQERKDEEKVAEDSKKLIEELEEQIKAEVEGDSSQPQEEEIVERTKNLIDALEVEEEKLKTETEALITKIETLESDVEGLSSDKSEGDASSVGPSTDFVNKLKERVREEDDLIARLKRESEKDIDPKTGKFKVMTAKEFKERAPSDFDFLKYLKDSLTNNEEFERDLEAFEGLLEQKFGPAVREVRKAAGPVVEDVVKELRETAGPAAESELDEIRRRATDAIEQLRKIF